MTPALSWAAFDLGSARARLRGVEGVTRESVAEFEQVVLRALEETENALVNYREDQQRLVKLVEQARESSRAAAIARVRYREGAADFLALLDAERTELQAEDAVAEAEAGVFTSVIAVYKATRWNTGFINSTHHQGDHVMTFRIATLAILIGLAGSSHAFAQSRESSSSGLAVSKRRSFQAARRSSPKARTRNGPSFGNYDLGGSVTVNVNRYVGVEGEVSGALGLQQRFNFNGSTLDDVRTPHLLNYSGNVIVNAARGPVVPYVTGGIGGQTLFEQAALGINDTDTFLTGNVGGGVKWYSGRWGLRGDYRFIAVQGKDDAPAFLGQDTRYGHRVYGGVVLNVVR